MMKKKYKVGGMNCAACVARVEKSVKGVSGVQSCEVNLLLGSMSVEGDVSDDAIIAAVTSAGYSASVEGTENRGTSDVPREGESSTARGVLYRLVPSAVLLLLLMYISMGHVMWSLPLPPPLDGNALSVAITQMLLSLVIMLINKNFFVSGVKGILHLSPNMDTLVALGSFASFAYSVCVLYAMSADAMASDIGMMHERLHELYFESAAMILVLITVGKLLEARAKGKTTSAIRSLMDLTPKMATVVRDGVEVVIPAKDISVGDIIIVKRGENVPADAEICEGELSVDESALTGESIPRDLGVGDTVLGATTVLSGYAKLRAIKVGEQTAIAEVIKMVKEASGSKAPVAKAADKVAGVFVPVVLCIAFVTALIWMLVDGEIGYALARAVCVLVISCPCALGLATPVAVMVGSGVGAKHGILFKTAASLEASGKIKTVAFDKTGTVTVGKPAVDSVIPIGATEEELIRCAYSLEIKSEHPLAKAVVEFAKNEKNITPDAATDFRADVGGVSGVICTERIFGGNLKYINESLGAELSESLLSKSLLSYYDSLSREGKTVLIFAKKDTVLGLIAISDRIRDDSAEAVRELRKMGITSVMITGDNRACAEYVAKQVGIERVIAEVLPGDKAKHVKQLSSESGTVAMVGDGINDSVALTEADVGIAIGAGADVAIDSADVVLKRSSILDVASAIKLGRRVLINIYENLFWAFCYNVIGIPLAAGAFIPLFGWELQPMFGALAMSISSFLVVSNALRLNFYRPIQNKDKMQTNINKSEVKEMKTVTLKIQGMMCPHCSGRVKSALEAHPAVASADVSHERMDAIITLNRECAAEELVKIVTDAGYKVID